MPLSIHPKIVEENLEAIMLTKYLLKYLSMVTLLVTVLPFMTNLFAK